ncbi:MAG: hypothetical protein ACKVQJ_15180 [Pyrinomonadaceae bacterium]
MLFILIPGIILVALMVYASTRIKKIAAAAFEAETIETDDFVIQKPDGFLHVLNGDPKYAFETYSKEYGNDSTGERLGRVNLTIRKGGTVDEVVAGLTASNGEILEDLTEMIGAKRYRIIETKRNKNDVGLNIIHRIAAKAENIYVVEAIRLSEASNEFTRKIEGFIGSFELK